MDRRVFLSYHFDGDVWRANQVRTSVILGPSKETTSSFDVADQEEVKRSSDKKIKRWIDEQLSETSVTAVLIGEETAERDYVRYELEQSFKHGNALLGVKIPNLKDQNGNTANQGSNPLSDYLIKINSRSVRLSEVFPTYDWVRDNGQQNMEAWIEEAIEAGQEVLSNWQENPKRGR